MSILTNLPLQPINTSAMLSSIDLLLLLHLWYQRLGHLNYQIVHTLGNTILDVNILKDQIKDHQFCIPCPEKHCQKYNKKLSKRAKKFLELVYSDLCGLFLVNL